MQKPILLLLLIFVFAASSYGQDLLAKKAPVDRKMKIADTGQAVKGQVTDISKFNSIITNN